MPLTQQGACIGVCVDVCFAFAHRYSLSSRLSNIGVCFDVFFAFAHRLTQHTPIELVCPHSSHSFIVALLFRYMPDSLTHVQTIASFCSRWRPLSVIMDPFPRARSVSGNDSDSDSGQMSVSDSGPPSLIGESSVSTRCPMSDSAHDFSDSDSNWDSEMSDYSIETIARGHGKSKGEGKGLGQQSVSSLGCGKARGKGGGAGHGVARGRGRALSKGASKGKDVHMEGGSDIDSSNA